MKKDNEFNKLIEVSEEDLDKAWIDEYGVKYSEDKKRLLKAPDELKGKYVVLQGTETICKEAFDNVEGLKEVILPEGLKNIGIYAFNSWDELINFPELPTSVENIGWNAFNGCFFQKFIIPKAIKEFEFESLPKAKEYGSESDDYSIIDGLLVYKKTLLKYLGEVTDVNVANGIIIIGEKAFENCSTLKNIKIPNTIEKIDSMAFYGCDSLKQITLPNSILEIGKNAFENCVSLQNVVLPNSLKEIKDGTFSHCVSLQNIVIPSSVEKIGNNAFECCGFESIDIPNSVNLIGDSAFKDCRNLSNVRLSSTTKVGRFAFCGTEMYKEDADIVESIIEASFKSFKCKLKVETIDEILSNIDEEDKGIIVIYVAVFDAEGEKKLKWSKAYDEIEKENLIDFLEEINDYCEDEFGKTSDELDFDVQYTVDPDEINSGNYGYWDVEEFYGGVIYAFRKYLEGDDYDYEDEDEDPFESFQSYGIKVHSDDGPFWVKNALFSVTWADGVKQHLFVDVDGDVFDLNELRLRWVAAPFEQITKEIINSLKTHNKALKTTSSVIKNIIETTMVAQDGPLTLSMMNRLARKYNPSSEDTIVVATIEPNGIAKRIIYKNDPLIQLLEDVLDEIQEFCEEELGQNIDDVDYRLEWPTKIKLLRGDVNRAIQEAIIIPYAICPDEDEEDIREDEEYYSNTKNCLIRIHWSNGSIQDLFIDKDLQVHDFNSMDKSYFPECDRKSFDELTK